GHVSRGLRPSPLTQGDRELMAQHEDLGNFHHDSRHDSRSSDTAPETIGKISFKPTGRRSSHTAWQAWGPSSSG
ncbi:MAG: hypothetical protein ACRDRJ_06615, partial [Streptosporangiaceae bacterium]